MHFLDVNGPKAQILPLRASPASVLSLCMYCLRIFRGTRGISSVSKRQQNCLLLVSMLRGTEMQFLVHALLIKSSLKLLHCSRFLEGTVEIMDTISYRAQMARPCSTFVWPGRALSLSCCRSQRSQKQNYSEVKEKVLYQQGPTSGALTDHFTCRCLPVKWESYLNHLSCGKIKRTGLVLHRNAFSLNKSIVKAWPAPWSCD